MPGSLPLDAHAPFGYIPGVNGQRGLAPVISRMSQLVAEIQTIILATFKLSEKEAGVQAGRLAGLAVGWSGEDGAAQVAWVHLVKKEFGDRFRWKSKAEHAAWIREHKERFRAYEFLYGSKPRG